MNYLTQMHYFLTIVCRTTVPQLINQEIYLIEHNKITVALITHIQRSLDQLSKVYQGNFNNYFASIIDLR